MNCSSDWLVASLRSRAFVPHRRSRQRPTDRPARPRMRGAHGVGVISAAIAVLIMAFLGALMWVGFQKMWTKTEDRTNQQIDHISTGP